MNVKIIILTFQMTLGGILFSIMNTVYLLGLPVKMKGNATVRSSQVIKSHGVKWLLGFPARWSYL